MLKRIACTTIEIKHCKCRGLLESALLRNVFPSGSDLRMFFTTKVLQVFRELTLSGKTSAFAYASMLKTIHKGETLPSLYSRFLAASRNYRALLFNLDTLRQFGLTSSLRGCPACKENAFVAVDGCFRLCRRRAAGKRRTEPKISQYFIKNASSNQTSSRTKESDKTDCSQFRNTQQGKTRSRFKTLDETGGFI
jgi:hypothetical protein